MNWWPWTAPPQSSHLFKKSICSCCFSSPVFIMMDWKHCRSMAHSLQLVWAVGEERIDGRSTSTQALASVQRAAFIGARHWPLHCSQHGAATTGSGGPSTAPGLRWRLELTGGLRRLRCAMRAKLVMAGKDERKEADPASLICAQMSVPVGRLDG